MDWLEKQIKSELDLGFRPKKKSQFIYKNDEPVAHFSLSKRGRLFELTTVVVDKSFRNQGITYEILEKCTQPSMVFTRNDFLKKKKAGNDPIEGLRAATMGRLAELTIVSWEIDENSKSVYKIRDDKLADSVLKTK